MPTTTTPTTRADAKVVELPLRALTPREAELIDSYRRLTPALRAAVARLIETSRAAAPDATRARDRRARR